MGQVGNLRRIGNPPGRRTKRKPAVRRHSHGPLAAATRKQFLDEARPRAYKWAWADGEPYVHRYELTKARTLLETLGAEIPDLPPYDPAKDEKFPCEDDVAAAIEILRAEKEAGNRKTN